MPIMALTTLATLTISYFSKTRAINMSLLYLPLLPRMALATPFSIKRL